MSIYTRIHSTISPELNTKIRTGFLENYQRDDVRKTHLFEGRYENIYLSSEHIPELEVLISEATALAEDIVKTGGLRAGYWFNYMPPGATTTLHSHDDDDELLSGVYYIDVPADSGKLVFHPSRASEPDQLVTLEPQAGDFLFFGPDVLHEVSRNNSDTARLSIGINFGKPR